VLVKGYAEWNIKEHEHNRKCHFYKSEEESALPDSEGNPWKRRQKEVLGGG